MTKFVSQSSSEKDQSLIRLHVLVFFPYMVRVHDHICSWFLSLIWKILDNYNIFIFSFNCNYHHLTNRDEYNRKDKHFPLGNVVGTCLTLTCQVNWVILISKLLKTQWSRKNPNPSPSKLCNQLSILLSKHNRSCRLI